MGMLWRERLLPNCQRASVEGLGLGVSALVLVQLRQLVEAQGYMAMLWSERLLPNCQRAPVE